MIRVGTCSWADESFVKAYYPAGVDRLRYYADRFDVVEANSTYYRLPDETLVARWAGKLPDGFVMHVKAFALMTRHPVKVAALPEDLRAEVSVDDRGRVDHVPADVREEVFRRFVGALEPLRASGHLGGILMQMAPYVVPRQGSYEYLAWAREQLGGHTMLVEFRHRAWFEQADETLDFLRANDMTHVIVDTPVFPVVVARTGPEAYVRFHGRNRATWYKRTGSTAERFDYLYSEKELADWACTLRELADEGAENVFAMFNNNGRSPTREAPEAAVGEPVGEYVAQAPTNAATLRSLLGARP
ncbi:MAG: DUF72 domain-containing protein [Thermoleophilia bacterium]